MKATAFGAALAIILASSALAQDRSIEFRLAADKGNLSQCMALDSALSRVHTVAKVGAKATITSSGGIDDDLKVKSPDVYTTTFSLSGVRLEVVADASVKPATLTVFERNRGCKWNAIAP